MKRIPSTSDLSFFEGEDFAPKCCDAHVKAWLRLCADGELQSAGVDTETFRCWLQKRMRLFLETRHVEAQFVAPADELAWLEHTRTLAEKLAPLVRYGAAPLRAHAKLATVAARGEVDLHALRDRLQFDLATLVALLGNASNDLRETPGKRGAKPDPARDSLLADVTAALRASGIGKAAAAQLLALKVLRSEGVEAPDPGQKTPEKAARRAARRVQK